MINTNIKLTLEQYKGIKGGLCVMCFYEIPDMFIGDSMTFVHTLPKTELIRVTCQANEFRNHFSDQVGEADK